MHRQADYKVRVVTLDNLKAMCEYVSGSYCHKYEVTKATPSRVWVSYSNEDEWAYEHPIHAVYRKTSDHNPMVFLEILRCVPDSDGKNYRHFDLLHDCPQLWRNPENGQWKKE